MYFITLTYIENDKPQGFVGYCETLEEAESAMERYNLTVSLWDNVKDIKTKIYIAEEIMSMENVPISNIK